jgi:tetratricopeptide (TPR) repeat protein
MFKKKYLFYFVLFFNALSAQEFYKADSLFQAGNYDKSLAIYMKSSNNYKYFKIAKYYESQDDFINANSNYKIYIDKIPDDYNSNYEYAKFLYDNKLVDQSIEILNKLVSLQENTMVFYYLGLCYEKKQNIILAKENFIKASKIDSYHLKSNYKAAYYLALESKFEEAETILNRILSKNKNKTDFILLKAQIHYAKKEFKIALENYLLMIKLFERDSFIYEKIAKCHSEMGNYQKSIDTWQEIIKIFGEKDNPDIEKALAANYAYLKNVKMAEFHYTNAIKLNQFTFENEYFTLAKLHKDNGNINNSIAYLNKAIKEKKDFSGAHYELLILTENKYSNKELLVKYEKLHQTYTKDFPKEINDFLILKMEDLRKKIFMN